METLNTKLYQLIIKETNEIVCESVSELAVRKEAISLIREESLTWDDIYVNQTFIKVSEWNNAMNEAIKNAKNN